MSIISKTYIFIFILIFSGCASSFKVNNIEKVQIDLLLNHWHNDVASHHFDLYFNKMTEDAVFVGTDASEVWNKQEFMNFSKPYFEKKQTWDFKPLHRNIYFGKDKSFAWFDETLETWMGICRGSGVVVKIDKEWKIKHYVLSVTVPNEDIQKVIEVKKETESKILKK